MVSNWKSVKESQPEPFVEVLVVVDGHRSAMWRNTYQKVAYMADNGKFWEAVRRDEYPLVVTHWKPLDPYPEE